MKTQLNLALAQVNVTVGALDANALHLRDTSVRAAEAGADLVVFPELAICGYPPEDLIFKRHFIEDVAQTLTSLAISLPPEVVVMVGAPLLDQGKVYNGAAIFHRGAMVQTYFKNMLPNYGVFDEKRVFAEGVNGLVLDLDGFRVGVHICEDSWYPAERACRVIARAGVDLLVNLSASPYHRGKIPQREATLRAAAQAVGAPLAYCNLVGGQDELVFDGSSVIVDPTLGSVARAAMFDEAVLMRAIPARSPRPSRSTDGADPLVVTEFPNLGKPGRPDFQGMETGAVEIAGGDDDPLAEVYAALCMGVRDYVDKNGFSRTVIGISGGIDSALVAAIAVDALGAHRVVGVTMPSRYSSEGTHNDAHALGEALGMEFYDVPIKAIHEVVLDQLCPLWAGRSLDTTEENLQARIRGNILMALSNKFGWLVLTTGNKSEIATGYCTLYGDMAGGYAVIKDVPKTLVYELSHWRNRQGDKPVIPPAILERPPSAELRDDQKDSDSLPPYDMLDAILERYVERDWGGDRIVADGFDPEVVRRVIHLVDGNEYKRRQGPPGIKITPKAFGRDRRLPVTNLYTERVKHPRPRATGGAGATS